MSNICWFQRQISSKTFSVCVSLFRLVRGSRPRTLTGSTFRGRCWSCLLCSPLQELSTGDVWKSATPYPTSRRHRERKGGGERTEGERELVDEEKEAKGLHCGEEPTFLKSLKFRMVVTCLERWRDEREQEKKKSTSNFCFWCSSFLLCWINMLGFFKAWWWYF